MSSRGVQNKSPDEDAAPTAPEEAILAAMRRDGLLRADRSGRPAKVHWLKAAMAANALLPHQVPEGELLTVLRSTLGAVSIASWLKARGLDGSQTRQLDAWLKRLRSMEPLRRDAAAAVMLWVNCPFEAGASVQDEASRAFAARQLAMTCREARDACYWSPLHLEALEQNEVLGQRWLRAWREARRRARCAAARHEAGAAASSCTASSATQLRSRVVSGSDPARFWQSVGAVVAQRNANQRSLRVPNRVILEALEDHGRGRRGSTGSFEPPAPSRRQQLALLLAATCGDERVHAFRAVRDLLSQYDGWK